MIEKLDKYRTSSTYAIIDTINEIIDFLNDTDVTRFKDRPSNIGNTPTINPYEWISVEDRLPYAGEEVIVAIKDEHGDYPYRYTASGWMTRNKTWVVDNEERTDITYYMPLPSPPTEKEN